MYMFACYHVWLVIRNTTTNETFKWSDAKAYKEYCRSLIENPDAVDNETKTRPVITQEMREWSKLRLHNSYNRGVFANFFEVFLPELFYRNARKRA